jgi:hypothetical protein
MQSAIFLYLAPVVAIVVVAVILFKLSERYKCITNLLSKTIVIIYLSITGILIVFGRDYLRRFYDENSIAADYLGLINEYLIPITILISLSALLLWCYKFFILKQSDSSLMWLFVYAFFIPILFIGITNLRVEGMELPNDVPELVEQPSQALE